MTFAFERNRKISYRLRSWCESTAKYASHDQRFNAIQNAFQTKRVFFFVVASETQDYWQKFRRKRKWNKTTERFHLARSVHNLSAIRIKMPQSRCFRRLLHQHRANIASHMKCFSFGIFRIKCSILIDEFCTMEQNCSQLVAKPSRTVECAVSGDGLCGGRTMKTHKVNSYHFHCEKY